MNRRKIFTAFSQPLPRWLLGIDAVIVLALAVFVATGALHPGTGFGPAFAFAVALCFPSAVLLGVVNGFVLATCRGTGLTAGDPRVPPRGPRP